jgi:hypothetical protein
VILASPVSDGITAEKQQYNDATCKIYERPQICAIENESVSIIEPYQTENNFSAATEKLMQCTKWNLNFVILSVAAVERKRGSTRKFSRWTEFSVLLDRHSPSSTDAEFSANPVRLLAADDVVETVATVQHVSKLGGIATSSQKDYDKRAV